MFALISVAFALDVDAFSTGATTGDPTAFTRLGSVATGKPGDWDAGLMMDYADAPLSEQLPTGRSPVIDALATANVTGGYSFGGLRLDGTFPVHFGTDSVAGSSAPYAAPGDARLGAQLTTPQVHGLALGALAVLPTGDDARYLGGPPRLLTLLRGGHEFGRVGVLALGGAVFSLPEQVGAVSAGVGPVLGAGAAYRISNAVSALMEIAAQGQSGLTSVPVEATLSARMRLPTGVWATVGAAAGMGDGVGASRWRAILGIGYSIRTPIRPPSENEPAGKFAREDDRDDDSIPDDADRCPDEAETVDGFEDEDGCPELDGDGDGVPFAKDGCPSVPILKEQDPRTSDGCPHVAELAGDRVALTQAIFFREGRAELLPSAAPVLAAVRDQILAHPEIALFLVEGYTNTVGSEAENLRLSDARAYSVMRWLVEHGVAPTRLLSKGFGETGPLANDGAPDALDLNRRVEFRVVHVEDLPPDARRLDVPSDAKR